MDGLTALSAAASTTLAAPVVVRYLNRAGYLDHPGARSSHTAPTPRGGGLAVLGGLAVAVGIAMSGGRAWPSVVILPALALAAVGLFDDRHQGGVSASFRLAAQVALGIVAGSIVVGPWGAALGAAVVPVIVNVVNFMDGINGITALTLVAWGASTLVANGVLGSVFGVQFLALITVGTAVGFLPWNLPRARLFLGDVGSYLYGGLVAGAILLAWGTPLRWAVIAPLAPYLADVSLTLLRRARRGARLTEAHREHTYQRLVHETGLTHTKASACVAFAALCSGMPFALGWHGAAGVLVAGSVVTLYLALPALRGRIAHRA